MRNYKLEVREKDRDNSGVFTLIPFKRGEVIHTLHGLISAQPDRESVEIYMVIEEDQIQVGHILDPIFRYCNHSFGPNCAIDKSKQQVVALRDIESEEELKFNYLTNESQITHPFTDIETGKEVSK